MRHPFEYQQPTEAQIVAMQAVGEACKRAYEAIQEHVPQSAYRVLAIQALENANMWASKAVVFDGEWLR